MCRPSSLEANFGDEWRLFACRKVFFQCFHVVAEGLLACRGDFAGGAGHLALETFLDGDVAGGGEFVDLYAQVPGGGTCLLFQIGEIGIIGAGQDGHHRQPELRMKDGV